MELNCDMAEMVDDKFRYILQTDWCDVCENMTSHIKDNKELIMTCRYCANTFEVIE